MLKIRDLFFDNKKLIAALILFSLIQECAPLVIGLIQKRAFDALAKHHGSLFWLTILVFIGVVILINLSRQRYGMLDARITFNTDKTFINKLFAKLPDFGSKHAADLLNVVNVDLPSIDFVALTITDLCVKFAFLVGSLVILFSYSQTLTVAVIIPLIVVQTVILIAQKYNGVLYGRARKASLNYFNFMFDLISNNRYMRFLGVLHPEAELDRKNKQQLVSGLKQATYAAFLTNMIAFINMLAIAFTLLIANQTKEISPGTIALFLTYIAPGFDFVTISNQTLELLQRIRFVEAKIAQFFQRKGRDDAGYNQTRDRLKKQFKNSSVVLRGGDILCIEGQNGSGKSRLLRELANEPAKYLNLPAADFKLPDFAVGYLPENPAVFHESLANNIHLFPGFAFGTTPVAKSRSVEKDLLDILGISARFHTDTQINASTISTGEKQRIALARAALSSQLLILDRPFDVVDMARGQAILAWLKAHGYIIVLTADQQWVKQQATNLFTV